MKLLGTVTVNLGLLPTGSFSEKSNILPLSRTYSLSLISTLPSGGIIPAFFKCVSIADVACCPENESFANILSVSRVTVISLPVLANVNADLTLCSEKISVC